MQKFSADDLLRWWKNPDKKSKSADDAEFSVRKNLQHASVSSQYLLFGLSPSSNSKTKKRKQKKKKRKQKRNQKRKKKKNQQAEEEEEEEKKQRMDFEKHCSKGKVIG
ncbi:hypothetical protein M8J77_009847 [Diaphorina citri]|nr:hypothetical protein M8J77_009847 [Diaphorina citri]